MTFVNSKDSHTCILKIPLICFDGKTCFSTLSYRVSNFLIEENFGTNQYENNAETHPIKAPIATSKG